MMEQFVHNKLSLLLKIILQNTPTLQLFMMTMKTELFTKVIKTPSCKACLQRPSGLIKREGVKSKRLSLRLRSAK